MGSSVSPLVGIVAVLVLVGGSDKSCAGNAG
eukprot:COSAG06_NODE_7783_length_2378_cov_1.742870_7_plen_31_part_00